MMFDNDFAIQIECSCGAIFEPVNIVVDRFGERWAVCPECGNKTRLRAKE